MSAGGDRRGQLRGELVHVGEAVGHRHRQLRAGGAFGDALADRLGEGELAAQVARALGVDPEVGADGGDPVVVVEGGARLPAVGELALLVGEGELFALVGLRLHAPDLVRGGVVVEQQHDQAADGDEALEAVGGGELVAGPGGEQPSLPVEQHHPRLIGVRAPADARDQLPGAHQQGGSAT